MMKFLRTQMKWIMALVVIAFLLSTFFMYEGRSTRRTPGRNADGSMTDYEVAKINGRSLMRSELEQRLRDYLSNYGSRSAESWDVATFYRAVLDTTVLESQLAKEVEENGIRVSDAEAEQAMKDYADRYYPTRETFYQALAQSGIRVEDYKKNLARQMAQEQLIRNAIGEVIISEDRAMEFYETMKTLIYSRPEGFMVHMSDFNNETAAEGFRNKLLNGESWDVIVSNDELVSTDVINITKAPVFLPISALQSGTLSVMASVDVGQPSAVFSVSSFDFAVGLKTAHVDETVSQYSEVSDDIKNLLINQEERRRLTEYQTALRNKAQLIINDEELFASPANSEDVNEVLPGLTEEVPETVTNEKSEGSKENEPATETSESSAQISETTEATSTANEAEPEETAPETTEQVEVEEPKTEETPAVETPEETSTEEKVPEVVAEVEEAKPGETTPETIEQVEAEEPKTEETPAVETPEETSTEETTPEIVAEVEEAKSEETEASAVEEPKPEEAQPEAPVAEVEEVKAEIEEAPVVEAVEVAEEVITESIDVPVQEEITEEITTEAVEETAEEVQEEK